MVQMTIFQLRTRQQAGTVQGWGGARSWHSSVLLPAAGMQLLWELGRGQGQAAFSNPAVYLRPGSHVLLGLILGSSHDSLPQTGETCCKISDFNKTALKILARIQPLCDGGLLESRASQRVLLCRSHQASKNGTNSIQKSEITVLRDIRMKQSLLTAFYRLRRGFQENDFWLKKEVASHSHRYYRQVTGARKGIGGSSETSAV